MARLAPQSYINSQSINLLKIHSLNVNSLVSKIRRHNLNVHLEKHNPDVMFLSETCLRNSHKLNFANYSFIRADKTDNTRGTGILIRSTYKFKRIVFPGLTDFEYTAISLKDNLGSSLSGFIVYA